MPSSKILVAGATGRVGLEVVRLLNAKGYAVTALTRRRTPPAALSGLVDSVVTGDTLAPSSLASAFSGVDGVVSCLGASVDFALAGRAGYFDVDLPANRHLIDAARHAGVRRFVYVSAHAAPGYERTSYVRAHEAVVEHLRTSGLAYGVVRPTGVFPIFDTFLDLARRGFASIPGDGTARTNPVHPADVAEACVQALESPEPIELAIGGPDVMSRQEIVELAFHTVGKTPRIAHVPPALFLGVSRVLRPVHPRLGDLLDFAARVFTHDSIAGTRGRRTLAAYFAERS